MVKQILGITVMVLMIGMLIVGIVDKNTNKPGVANTGENNAEGVGIVAPGQTNIEQGKMAPDFELKSLSGETLWLSDLRGKKVILNFWASWCSPCKKEMPEMQDFYEKHSNEVEIVAVNLTGSEVSVDTVKKYIDKYNYTYPILLDKELKVQEKYNVTIIPTTYFIGSDGKVQLPRKAGPMTYEFMVEMVNKLN